MRTERTRRTSASTLQIKRILLGNVFVLGLGLALALGSAPATAKVKHKSGNESEHISKAPFGEIPKGPLQAFISISQQKLHLYSDGVHVTDTLVATGVSGHLTPMGVFSVIERDRYHHSNIYDNAPMPFMERITWSGVALHEGQGVGHQASHGCIRMPREFAQRLWGLSTMGMRVVIARSELQPTEFADPHLFVHKDRPLSPAASLTAGVKTAQSIDAGTATDVIGAAVRQAPTETTDPSGDPVHVQPTPASTPEHATNVIAEPAKTAAEPAAPAPDGAPATTATAAPAPAKAVVTEAATPSKAAGPAPAKPTEVQQPTGMPASITAPVTATLDDVPLPLSKPAGIAGGSHGPIAIFVSRKEGKIFVRQNFTPLFEAAIKIQHADQPLGTHVFTALDFLDSGKTTLRWNVVTLPGEQPRAAHSAKSEKKSEKHGRHNSDDEARPATDVPSPQTPQEVLARIEIPQDVIDQISQLIIPGSSLVVSDQGLGSETGSGTDFIVVTR